MESKGRITANTAKITSASEGETFEYFGLSDSVEPLRNWSKNNGGPYVVYIPKNEDKRKLNFILESLKNSSNYVFILQDKLTDNKFVHIVSNINTEFNYFEDSNQVIQEFCKWASKNSGPYRFHPKSNIDEALNFSKCILDFYAPTSKLFKNFQPHVDTKKVFKESNICIGSKKDYGKLPIATIVQKQFPNAIKAISECSLYGHEKYKDFGDEDWLNLHRVENGVDRYANAMMRHLLDAGINFEDIDPETGLNHIKHAVWNALALLELIERNKL